MALLLAVLLFASVCVADLIIVPVSALNNTYAATAGSCQSAVGAVEWKAWDFRFAQASPIDATKFNVKVSQGGFGAGTGSFDAITGIVSVSVSQSFFCNGVVQVLNPVFGFQLLCNVANLGFCDVYFACSGPNCSAALN